MSKRDSGRVIWSLVAILAVVLIFAALRLDAPHRPIHPRRHRRRQPNALWRRFRFRPPARPRLRRRSEVQFRPENSRQAPALRPRHPKQNCDHHLGRPLRQHRHLLARLRLPARQSRFLCGASANRDSAGAGTGACSSNLGNSQRFPHRESETRRRTRHRLRRIPPRRPPPGPRHRHHARRKNHRRTLRARHHATKLHCSPTPSANL